MSKPVPSRMAHMDPVTLLRIGHPEPLVRVMLGLPNMDHTLGPTDAQRVAKVMNRLRRIQLLLDTVEARIQSRQTVALVIAQLEAEPNW